MLLHQPLFCDESIHNQWVSMVSFCDYLFFGAVETTRFGHKYVSDPSLLTYEYFERTTQNGSIRRTNWDTNFLLQQDLYTNMFRNQRYQTFSAVNPSSFSVRSGNFQCNPSCSPVVYLMIAMLLHQPLFCDESIHNQWVSMVSFCDYLFFGAVETTRFGHKYVSDPSLAEEERIDSAYKLQLDWN